MTIPYATATSGLRAREEILKILRRFGCESVGFMDEFGTRSVALSFTYRGRNIYLRASAQGWANAYLKENPWTKRRHSTRNEWENNALEKGMVAVNSVLRDWVKGQMTAVETGMMTFDHVFLAHMLLTDGRPLIEQVQKLLPSISEIPALGFEQ